MRTLASRLSVVQPSATLAIAQRANELRAQGVDVISFSLGEPDFDTPLHIRDAAKRAIDTGTSHYTEVRGIRPLRDAICADSLRRRGVKHEHDEVVVTVGAKHALYNLALALYDVGDEVIIPAPCWVSYPEQVRLLGAKPVIVPTAEADDFCMSPAALEAAITPKTKALILCSPSNPTGTSYSRDALAALAEVARKHDFWIIVDEIYGRLVYDGVEAPSILSVAPDLRDRVIVVDGVSKTYAMTGWRIGWLLAPRALAKACDTMQGQVTSNAAAVSQHAALAGLNGSDESLETMRQAFDARRKAMVQGLSAIPGLRCRLPSGAFYAFPDVRGWYGKTTAAGTVLKDDVDVAKYWLESARVAAVPGTPFEGPGYVRLSYATSMPLIEEGLRRIAEAGRALRD